MEEIIEKLEKYHQNHIIALLTKLDENQKQELIEQIKKINIGQIMDLYENTKKEKEIKENKIEEIKYENKEKLSNKQKERYEKLGESAIKEGKYAVVTMAGGQGTRLGHSGPKGTFKLDVGENGKYLFQILIENLQEANKKYSTIIPWYIMTSKENKAQTVKFLEVNNYFGYDTNYIKIFTQDELPLIDTNGKLLIGKDMKIREAANGNGVTYESLKKSGCIDDMKNRGIEWVFIGAVDNALLKMADTIFLGMAIDKNAQIASKSIVKACPEEKVGIFGKKNGHPTVIEYTELPKEMAEERNKDGELKYSEAHIMCNLFSIGAIEKVSKEKLKYHTAFKANSYVDEEGREIIPKSPNSYKFETFIFDAFEFFDDIAILRGKREEDFAPIKNKEGVDSPETAKKLYESYFTK
jgi:UDP-N-acetylglucosamine pyrophosphorylase